MSNKKILKDLEKLNFKKSIKIRVKELKSGTLSIYLDFFKNNKRTYEFLKLYLYGDTKSKIKDKATLNNAISIRDKKESQLLALKHDIPIGKASYTCFYEYLEKKKATLDNVNTLKSYKTVELMLRELHPILYIQDINKEFLEDLVSCLTVANSSKRRYVNNIIAILHLALKDGVIYRMPEKPEIRPEMAVKEFLLLDELRMVEAVDFKYKHVQNAFLFSCYTGLRISDIISLTFDNLRDNYISIYQKKTGDYLKLKLNSTAAKIVEDQKTLLKRDTGLVFYLKNYDHVQRQLSKLVEQAGIEKHITFHCGRHTFATMCLTYDVDIFTLQKLLGHRDIASTLVYAKLIDKKRDEAIDKLPEL